MKKLKGDKYRITCVSNFFAITWLVVHNKKGYLVNYTTDTGNEFSTKALATVKELDTKNYADKKTTKKILDLVYFKMKVR